MGTSNYGLNILMEALHHTESAQNRSNVLTTLFEESIDDDIIGALIDDDTQPSDDDTVDNDISGNGIGIDEENKIKELVDNLPESPTDKSPDEEDLEDLIESYLPTINELQY